MEFMVHKSKILSLVSKTQNIAEKKASIQQTLNNILLEVESNRLKIFVTDLEVSLTDCVEIENFTKEGKAVVSAKLLFEIIKELEDDDIKISTNKENNWLKIEQKKTVSNLVGIDPQEYPVFPKINLQESVAIEGDILKDMIDKTIFSISNDETRYHLNGVFIERNDLKDKPTYRMVSTDGHRLCLVDKKINFFDTDSDIKGVIIPRKGLNEIKKLIEISKEKSEFRLSIDGPQLIVNNQNTFLMIRLIEGTYPNYQQLIPKNLKKKLLLKRNSFLSMIKRVSILSNHKSKAVIFSLSNKKLEISTNNPELGDAKEEMEIDYEGEDLCIGFNARYLLEALNSFDQEEIEFELGNELSPGIIKPYKDSSYKCVIMPMRL